jgi:hypothetical protein
MTTSAVALTLDRTHVGPQRLPTRLTLATADGQGVREIWLRNFFSVKVRRFIFRFLANLRIAC